MLRIIRYLALTALVLLVFLTSPTFAQQRCCARTVATLPIPLQPPHEKYTSANILANAFESPLHRPHEHGDCPLPVDILSYRGSLALRKLEDAIGKTVGAAPDPLLKKWIAKMHNFTGDYVFVGTLNGTGVEAIDDCVHGNFTLVMKFTDNCPDRIGTVVKAGQTSWAGCAAYGQDPAKALGSSFNPLDDLIENYERIPESCTVHPEKDKVKIGERITINLRNIVGRGGTPPSWQRLGVKVEKGDILNGTESCEGYHVFEIGSGSVEVEYEAPEECPEDKTDKIIAVNTCNSCPTFEGCFLPEDEIGNKEIEIICQGEIEINSYMVCDSGYTKTEIWTMGSVPFYIIGDSIEGDEPVDIQITEVDSDDFPCLCEGTGVMKAKVTGGNVVPNPGADPQLYITIEDIEYKESRKLHCVCECPAPIVCPIEYDVYNPTSDITREFDLELTLQDGFEIEENWQQGDCTGTNNFILHLPE